MLALRCRQVALIRPHRSTSLLTVVTVTAIRRALLSSVPSSTPPSSGSGGEATATQGKQAKSPLRRLVDWLSFRPGAPGYAMFARKEDMPGAEKAYRYPSPGSAERGEAKVPQQESDDLVYSTQYYTRDVRRNQQAAIITANNVEALPFPKEIPQLGSPGRFNANVAAYDPSGSRSAMTTSYKAMNTALEQHRANHLPRPTWMRDPEAVKRLTEEAKRKGIPQAVGATAKFKVTSGGGSW